MYKDHLRERIYGLGQVSMAVTLSSRLEIPRNIFKEKNKVMTNDSSLSAISIHSHDEYNAQRQGYNIKGC